MESTAKTRFRVGIFVTVGLIVVLLFIIMLGGDKMLLAKKVHLVAMFPQVQGLAEGSVVSLSGLNIGNVNSIDYHNESKKVRVVLSIDATYLKSIPEDSSVEIRTQGALGDKFIFINPGANLEKSVQEGGEIAVASGNDFMGVLSEKGDDARKIFEIISEVHKITKAFNENGKLEKTMSNLLEASSAMKAAATDSQKLVKQFRDEDSQKITNSISKLDNILNKIDRGEGSLGALINDPSLHESLKNLLGAGQQRSSMKSLIRTSIERSEKKN